MENEKILLYNYKKNLLEMLISLNLKEELNAADLEYFYSLIQQILKNKEQDEDILEAIDNILLKIIAEKKIDNTIEQQYKKNLNEKQNSLRKKYYRYNNINMDKIQEKRIFYDKNQNFTKFLSYRIFCSEDEEPNSCATQKER